MKTSLKTLTGRYLAPALVSVLTIATCRANIVGPYTTDVNTLHLWHMDQSAAPVLDTVSTGGTNLTALLNGATLANTSFSGFGTAVNTYGTGLLGAPSSISPLTLPNGYVSLTYADPATGAFTYEAIIQVNYNPTLNLGTTANGGNNRGTALTIISGEGNSTTPIASRIFNFRLDPIGFSPSAGVVISTPSLEFVNVNNGTSPQNIQVPIPTSGPDAIVQGGWYHVAVTYNGQPGTANNINFYWTLMDSSRTSASLIGSATMAHSLFTGGTPSFAIGNTGRNPSGSTSNPLKDNFLGLIDEVRLSKVARSAGQMMFSAPVITVDVNPVDLVTVLGQTVSFSVSASGIPPLRYQWRHDNVNILNATQAVYTISSVVAGDAGNYDVVITNGFSTATSSAANLSIRTPVDLTWAGFGYMWDISSSPAWMDVNSVNTVYTEGDNVTFDNQGTSYPSVPLWDSMRPNSVVVNSDSDYTFTTVATGGIFGKTGLSKQGAGNLILDVNNGYAGPTIIANGTIQVGAGGTRGTLGTGAVTNNGGLVFNRTDSITVNNNIAGTGGLANVGAGNVILGGTNTFTGTVAVGAAATGGILTFVGNQALGKSTNFIVNAFGGAGGGLAGTRLALSGGVTTATNAVLRLLDVYAAPERRCILYTDAGTNAWNGPIILDQTDPQAGGPNGTLGFAANAINSELDIFGPVTGTNFQGKLTLRGTGGLGTVNGVINLPAGQVNATETAIWTIKSTGNSWISSDLAAGSTLRLGANNALPTGVILNLTTGGKLDLAGYNQQIAQLNGTNATSVIGSSSTISDSVLTVNTVGASTNWAVIQDSLSGGTRKVGLTLTGGSLTLTNVNTYSGDTVIGSGTLYLLGAGSIANSSNINIVGGATLDASGRSGGGVTLGANQTLKGNGAFNVVGNLVSAGTVELKVSKSGATVSSDSVQGASQITYGGTLKLVISGSPLVGNEAIKLFNAAAYTGTFANIIPATPGPGLAWNSGTLGTDGTLRVIPIPVVNQAFSTSGTSMTMSGSHGPPLLSYVVMWSVNIDTPKSSWIPFSTNAFDASGNFTCSVPISTNFPRRFFTIKIP